MSEIEKKAYIHYKNLQQQINTKKQKLDEEKLQVPHAEKQKHSITTTPETKKLYIQSLDNLNETEKNYVISSIKK